MAFCCFDSLTTNSNDAYQRQTGDALPVGGNYPGARRMMKTGGNALQAAPVPSQPYDNNISNGYQQRHHQQQPGKENNILQGKLELPLFFL